MIYIPAEWLHDEKNMDQVHGIIESALFSEINLSSRIEEAIQRLRDIGEPVVADKLQNGEIMLPV